MNKEAEKMKKEFTAPELRLAAFGIDMITASGTNAEDAKNDLGSGTQNLTIKSFKDLTFKDITLVM